MAIPLQLGQPAQKGSRFVLPRQTECFSLETPYTFTSSVVITGCPTQVEVTL
jgi:hypothetical protein